MNFGQNLYQWFLSNAQSLVLMAMVVIGITLDLRIFQTDRFLNRCFNRGWIGIQRRRCERCAFGIV